MKAVVLTGIRQMEIRDVPDPEIKRDTDVLLKIERVGVCGSDVHYYETGRIGSQIVQYPYIVGHECSATVVEVGKEVDKVKRGDEIVVEPAVSCDKCEQCRMGRENTCYNLKFLGTPGQGEGCLSEYIVMPQKCCFPTRGAITLEQAALCEPFAIGVYTVKNSMANEDTSIAILGSGPIGLSCMIAAKAKGINLIFMTDKLDYRVDIDKEQNAVWAGNPDREDIVKAILEHKPLGVDVVYECAGKQETIDEAVELLRPGGVIMLVGIPQLERISFAIDKIRRKELTIINVRRQNHCAQTAIDLVASGKARIDFMATHHFEFEQSKKAFDMVSGYSDGVVKAIIEF
ncbi:MAG: zinc-dependent alcohol dehydrogenase [Planctomycetota bacterium]